MDADSNKHAQEENNGIKTHGLVNVLIIPPGMEASV